MFVLLFCVFTNSTTPRLRRPARSEPLRPARVEGANGGLDARRASVATSSARPPAWPHTIRASDTTPQAWHSPAPDADARRCSRQTNAPAPAAPPVLMTNGEHIIYECRHGANIYFPPHLFLGHCSDGRWLYSSYHFCNSMRTFTMAALLFVHVAATPGRAESPATISPFRAISSAERKS